MNDGQANGYTATRAGVVMLACLLTGLSVVLIDSWDGHLYYGDLDDRMRALQIRDLLNTGDFFNLELGFVALPEPYVSHYSRLVDLPYFVIALAGKPVLGVQGALEFAFLVWPPVMLVIFVVLALYSARKINGCEFGLGQSLVLVVLSSLAILEFSPGRIDHHNVQLLLMMMMVAGIAAGSRRGGYACGFAAACSIAIGLESIPYIAAGLGGLALAAVFRPGRFVDQLTATGAGFAIAAIPAGFLSLGPDGVLARSCDAIGMPWVSAIIAAGAILVFVPLIWPLDVFSGERGGTSARLISLAIPALAAGAGLIYLYPECAGDPYGNVQGIARELWFNRIRQEKPLTAVFTEGSISVAALCGIYGFVIVAGCLHAIRRARSGDLVPAVIFTVAAVSFAFFFVLFRSVRFMAVFVPMFVPAAFYLRHRAFPEHGKGDRASRGWLIGGGLIPVVLIASVFFVSRGEEKPLSVFDQMLVDDCKDQDISVLATVEGGNVLASYAMSYRIAEDYPRHRIAALPLHRAARGVSRLLTAYTETNTDTRNAALAPYDYLAVCARDFGVPDMDRTPLFKALASGQTIAGLEPVGTVQDTAFRLYRIKMSDFGPN